MNCGVLALVTIPSLVLPINVTHNSTIFLTHEYIRITNENGECLQTSLVCSKTRVTPIKTITIPRLELCGTHLLAKLMNAIKQAMGNIHECLYWTDSRIVKSWIESPPNQLKQFIANRVAN